jgi:hypothetical protein
MCVVKSSLFHLAVELTEPNLHASGRKEASALLAMVKTGD